MRIILGLLAVWMSGVLPLAASPKESLATKKVVLVSAFEPILFGQKIGFGTFLANGLMTQQSLHGLNTVISMTGSAICQKLGNEGWYGELSGLDVNETIMQTAQATLGGSQLVMDGREAGILGDIAPLGIHLSKDELAIRKERLEVIGREKGADVVVILHSAVAADWMQKSGQSVYGIGHFYTHRDCAYCVLSATLYDCRTGKFSKGPVVHHARRALGVDWHKTLAEYPPAEQRALMREVEIVLKECVPVLLEQLGLTKGAVSTLPLDYSFLGEETPKSFIPDGNEIAVPRGISVKTLHDLIKAAYGDHEWTVTEDVDGRMVATHRKGKKEAICTVAYGAEKITVHSEGFKWQDDGARKPVDFYKGWHENMKEAIVTRLMQVEGEGSALPTPDPAKPQAAS